MMRCTCVRSPIEQRREWECAICVFAYVWWLHGLLRQQYIYDFRFVCMPAVGVSNNFSYDALHMEWNFDGGRGGHDPQPGSANMWLRAVHVSCIRDRLQSDLAFFSNSKFRYMQYFYLIWISRINLDRQIFIKFNGANSSFFRLTWEFLDPLDMDFSDSSRPLDLHKIQRCKFFSFLD